MTASPLFASGIVGASALALAGNEAQQGAWLPRIADGSAIVTLAVDEGPRHAPLQTRLAAKADGDGFVLDGRKVHVLEGLTADAFVVAARTSGSAGDAEGLTPSWSTGTRRASIAPASRPRTAAATPT